MKTIILYLREFFREQWDPPYFLVVGGLLGVLFFLNYYFGLEHVIVRNLSLTQHILFYFALYFIPYVLVHAAYALLKHDPGILLSSTFWMLSIFTFVVLASYVTLHDTPDHLLNTQQWLFDGVGPQFRPFAARCASNIVPLALMGVPLVAYWWRTDRMSMSLYGFNAKTIDLQTYFMLLFILLPLVFTISFMPAFQYAYPRHKFGFPTGLGGGEQRMALGLFELCYGADFVFVEFFFRGFMVLAFTRLLGSRAIIPMVTVYALIHFEKPLLEAISSIAGGLVLGVISYRTRSIYGGIILHLGIAYAMELAGTLQMTMQ